MVHVIGAHLLKGAKCRTTSGDILWITHVDSPRPVSAINAAWLERKEGEVAVGHVVILGAEQKPPLLKYVRVAEHDHCVTSHNASLHCFVHTAGSLQAIGSNVQKIKPLLLSVQYNTLHGTVYTINPAELTDQRGSCALLV